MSGVINVDSWCKRIDRWVKEETELSNVFMLQEPELRSYLNSQNYMIAHPMRRDNQGKLKADTNKFVIRSRRFK
jgi:hypothetical protein